MIAIVLALASAASNALAVVLQRAAATSNPGGSLLALLRRPVWLAGMAALAGGFVLQAAALTQGALILVQPILAAEMPFTLVMAALVTGLRPGTRDWAASVEMAAGLALVLAAAAPSGGAHDTTAVRWVTAAAATVALVLALVALSRRWPGPRRAALLGAGAGIGLSLAAVFMDAAAFHAKGGVGALFASWQVYALVVTGAGSLYLLQRALAAGELVAAQPASTVSGPLASFGYGIGLFGEHIRGGFFLIPQLVGAALVVQGAALLARSPLLLGEAPGGRDGPRAGGQGAGGVP